MHLYKRILVLVSFVFFASNCWKKILIYIFDLNSRETIQGLVPIHKSFELFALMANSTKRPATRRPDQLTVGTNRGGASWRDKWQKSRLGWTERPTSIKSDYFPVIGSPIPELLLSSLLYFNQFYQNVAIFIPLAFLIQFGSLKAVTEVSERITDKWIFLRMNFKNPFEELSNYDVRSCYEKTLTRKKLLVN